MSDAPDRSQLARDLVVFQVKLIVDGVRDLLLSPVAFFAALLGLISSRPASRQLFYDVVRFGRRTEHWIDPFGVGSDSEQGDGSLSDLLSRMERQVRDQYERGHQKAAQTTDEPPHAPDEDSKPPG